jgi:hypothetical protein
LAARTRATPVTDPDVLTTENAAQGVTLKVGERFLLNLGELGWEVELGDETILRWERDPSAPPGSQGYFVALKPGRTAIRAVSNPPCRQAKPPCMMPSVFLQIPVTVVE